MNENKNQLKQVLQSQSSSVIDFDDMELIDNDASDYESDFRARKVDSPGEFRKVQNPGFNSDIWYESPQTELESVKMEGDVYQGGHNDPNEDIRQRISQNVTEMVWQAGKQQATKAWNLYGNIDILRPYFDVQPHEVKSRLLQSLMPQKPTGQRQNVPRELYGPMMVIFTLIALLLFQMKSSGHKVQEGTLMGTSFVVCFTYWFGSSGAIFLLSYLCNISLSMIQILSMLGYGLFGHCLVVFLSTVIHSAHNHIVFYILWAIFGGLSTLRMAFVILSRTSGQSQRMIVCGTITFLHLCFLLYLHFAYHQTVEELSEVFNKDLLQKPVVVDSVQPKFVRELGNEIAMATHALNKQVVNHEPNANLAIDKIDKVLQPVHNTLPIVAQKLVVAANNHTATMKAGVQLLLKAVLPNDTRNVLLQ